MEERTKREEVWDVKRGRYDEEKGWVREIYKTCHHRSRGLPRERVEEWERESLRRGRGEINEIFSLQSPYFK